MASGIPQTSGDITAGWLTGQLRDAGHLPPGSEVASIDVEPLAAGVGFMGEVTRIRLAYAGDAGTAPSVAIAKIPTQDPNVRAMMKPARVFEREARFYAELADKTPLRTPTCYVCSFDLDADDFLLVFEDLSHLELGDQLAGCTPEQAELALVGLARHHAAFWHGRGLESADFVPEINGELNRVGRDVYAASLPGFKEVFGHLVKPELADAVERFGANVHQMLDRYAAMPHTLVHFDWRADNLFFGPSAAGPPEVTAIDFQAISKGGGAADVGYFMSQNLSVADRRAHEEALLRAYHDTLAAAGVTGYPFDQFRDDYRVGVMYGWIIPVFATGTLDASSERAIALWTEVIERSQTAIGDLDAAELLTI